jgi:hypothetical protein
MGWLDYKGLVIKFKTMKYRKGEFLVIPNKTAMKGLKPSTQTVYLWICSFADESGQCFPSINLIAEYAGVSRMTVITSIKELEKLGILSHKKRKAGIENLTNLYQIEIVESIPPSQTIALPHSQMVVPPSQMVVLPPSLMVGQGTESTLLNSNHLTVGVPTPSKKFIRPTIQDIENYCKERGNSVDPERFFNFYESKGWMIGKSPMKNWKAAVHTWEKESAKASVGFTGEVMQF